jgi:transcriptional regulator GlxA family with amidase domain
MAEEARETRAGGEAVVTRLSDILVIQAIRSWITHDPAARQGWMGALRDPDVGRVMAAIHRAPERDWALAGLAAEAGMSRSAFAKRFTELVGTPAMQYVARWRMYLAEDLLRDTGTSVKEAGARVGYASEAAFSRAYKRTTGRSPVTAKRAPPAR